MCWFWRAAIAVGVAGFYGCLTTHPSLPAYLPYAVVRRFLLGQLSYTGDDWIETVAKTVAWYLPIALIAVGLYAFLGRESAVLGETRCRKCGYILRGLSEPRCPECGEKI